jgi:putative transposase
MHRTIKAYSLDVNVGKWAVLESIAAAYAAEKGDHLHTFANDTIFGNTQRYEQFRDALLDAQYISPHGLQGRMWKLALKDAYETVVKQWASLTVELRGQMQALTGWSGAQKHYARWLLKDEKRLARLVGEAAPLAAHIDLTLEARKQVQNYLRRAVRRHRGQRAQVKMVRSFCLDANMYKLFEANGRSYIAIATLTPRERVHIPLTGHHALRGNLRIVLDRQQQRLEVHYTAEVPVPQALREPVVGLDAGLTEVFTDEQGSKYGAAFGQTLVKQSDELCDKGRKRNKLHALEKQYRHQGKTQKANHIRKFNLGTHKLRRRQTTMRHEIQRQINTEINQLLERRRPACIVSEKLDMRGKAPHKRLSRRVSGWARGTLDERLGFKASAGGSTRKHVNPAYSSQLCPRCGFLDKKNRHGDTFQCQYCGHRDDADRVAAHNLLARWNDPEITLFTPKARVRAILLDRFSARLREAEANQSRSVSGRTPGTKPRLRQPESETTGSIPQYPSARH